MVPWFSVEGIYDLHTQAIFQTSIRDLKHRYSQYGPEKLTLFQTSYLDVQKIPNTDHHGPYSNTTFIACLYKIVSVGKKSCLNMTTDVRNRASDFPSMVWNRVKHVTPNPTGGGGANNADRPLVLSNLLFSFYSLHSAATAQNCLLRL